MKNRNRKIHPIFLSLCLLILMTFPVHAAEAEEVIESRLTITSKREFLEFAENCRLDRFSENLIVSLEADIDLTGNEFDGIPIFCGMFEGNHHTISGLNIIGNGSAKGLFRYLTENAVVQNLSVKGKVSPQGSSSYAGGIIGNNAGTVLNCNFSGDVKGKNYVGGIVGLNEVSGTIENCQTEGDIRGTHFAGGIAGENYGVIRDCTNLANVNIEVQKSSLEISDITIETLTSSEAAYIVTNVGGIAGSSSGVIKGCDNQGTVGYQHVGYNIGGIAGSQVGYLYDCENRGQIFGRKEVGGIAGQMEPVANLEFNADTLQILEGQLSSTADKIKQSSDKLQTQIRESSADMDSQMEKLQRELNNSGDAVTQLLKDMEAAKKSKKEKKDEDKDKEDSKDNSEERQWYDLFKEWEDLRLPDTDNILAARNSLNKSMSSMNETLNSITQNSQNTVDAFTDEMQGLVNRAKNITSTVAHASDNIGINIKDVSDEDSEDNLIAKIEQCKNMGFVQADLNGGGIIGAIALENDLDPENELEINGEISLNLEGELRAVVLNCENGAEVAVRNQNGGGIAGWLSLGLIRDCMNTGEVDAADADYIGGIVGRSTGYVRNNNAKCEISGNSYVGGIAGSGSIVSECRSMVQLNSGSERIGNVMGAVQDSYHENEEEPVKNNFYLCIGEDFGGIDGISYFGMAEPMERNQFLNLENLPEEFWKINVTFIKEDNSYEQVLVNHGGSLALADIPKVPEKEGYLGSWGGLEEADTEEILFDISFEAFYTPVKGTISSKTTGTNNKPILLLQGSFNATSEIALVETDTEPEEVDGQKIIDVFGFVLQEKEIASGARYLIPEDVKGEDISIYVKSPEVDWHETECSVDGSYVTFALKNEENQIAVLKNRTAPSLWGGVAAIVLVIFVIAIILEKNIRRNE